VDKDYLAAGRRLRPAQPPTEPAGGTGKDAGRQTRAGHPQTSPQFVRQDHSADTGDGHRDKNRAGAAGGGTSFPAGDAAVGVGGAASGKGGQVLGKVGRLFQTAPRLLPTADSPVAAATQPLSKARPHSSPDRPAFGNGGITVAGDSKLRLRKSRRGQIAGAV